MQKHAGEVRSLSVTKGSRQPAISGVSRAHRSLLRNACEVSPEEKEARKTTSCSKQVNSTLNHKSYNSLSTLQVKLVTFLAAAFKGLACCEYHNTAALKHLAPVITALT